MAATSSEDGSITGPPKVFHLSSSTDDSHNVVKCTLCRKFKKYFFCTSCVQNGEIFSYKNAIERHYIDIKAELDDLQNNKKEIEQNCLKVLDSHLKLDVLLSKIRQNKERNRILRLAVEEKKQHKLIYEDKLKQLKQKNQERSERIKGYKNKCEAMELYVERTCDKLSANYEVYANKQKDMKKLVRLRVDQLFKYIFPIGIVNPTVMESSDDMVKALAEASQTTYICDKWVYTDYSGEMKYSIVAPTLPGSGNYSAYNIWVAQNRDGVPGSSSNVPVEHNPAFSISAALTYTAQLIHVLAFFLNVRLPFKMVYSDFCNTDMNEQQFNRRVARLNANVLYLCISQNIDLSLLRPNEAIHNILQLIENKKADLGRVGPIEIDPYHAGILEQSLTTDLKVSEESDSDEGDSFTVEWEAVPHVQCPEIAAGPANVQSSQMMSTQQASSMAGGLMNSAVASVASIWRGFTGR